MQLGTGQEHGKEGWEPRIVLTQSSYKVGYVRVKSQRRLKRYPFWRGWMYVIKKSLLQLV